MDWHGLPGQLIDSGPVQASNGFVRRFLRDAGVLKKPPEIDPILKPRVFRLDTGYWVSLHD